MRSKTSKSAPSAVARIRVKGLQWRRRKNGAYVAYWIASDRKYKPSMARLWSGISPTREDMLSIRDQCARLQKQMKGIMPLSIRDGVVYFLGMGKYIKIGFTTNLKRRMMNFQVGMPEKIVLLLELSGTGSDEKRLHRQFGNLRLRGEWFQAAPELCAFIASKPNANMATMKPSTDDPPSEPWRGRWLRQQGENLAKANAARLAAVTSSSLRRALATNP